jgi:hypothetical protein
MKLAARADRSTEAGCNLVVAQIDVRAAPGTICRCCCVADLVFALAFKTGDYAVASAVPKAVEFSEGTLRKSGFFLLVKL